MKLTRATLAFLGLGTAFFSGGRSPQAQTEAPKAIGLEPKLDPPAPVDHIIGAHTIAPLDDGGGHVDPHAGYNYHAVTGLIKEVPQSDRHSLLVGYALDGCGLYGALQEGDEKTDECGGQVDDTRGYHYHVGQAGENRIIKRVSRSAWERRDRGRASPPTLIKALNPPEGPDSVAES